VYVFVRGSGFVDDLVRDLHVIEGRILALLFLL
jgi:hypothetical protein